MSRAIPFVLALVLALPLLIPGPISAHNAKGHCANCHTMHNSQDGLDEDGNGPYPNLLKFSCIGCHAYGTNLVSGLGDGVVSAPQVGPQVAGAGYINSGGYFSNGGGAEDDRTHNVAELFAVNSGADSIMLGAGATEAPGGVMLLDNGSGAPVLTCTSCHDLNIGHAPAGSVRAGDAASSYRMLHNGTQYVAGQGDLNYEADAGQNIYDAASMNLFCATCHGGFHGLDDTDSNGTGTGAWIRHPTDVSTSAYPAVNYDGSDKVVPVGDAGNTNMVMCISCHRPHGNANLDMIRFNFGVGDNFANDGSQSVGCESCHGAI